jgi:mRNA interferase RelE/StbE
LAWRIEISERAKKDIERLDRLIAKRVLTFLQTRLLPLNDPRSLGEALRGSTLGSYWKYRVGDYRIIANIEDDVLRIVVVRVGNRREIYRK